MLGPYLSSVNKLQKAINTRKYDCEALVSVAEEVEVHMSDTRSSNINEDDTKLVRLEQQKAKTSGEVGQITKEIQAMAKEERTLNDEILRLDRVFEDKWKLLNEM